ncbi:hypothetical protein [Halomonas llamarensis]|uniref:hypothetical protein n=1 Tax=Halomonas llamarensis TaxID=2945104 RepID=UPI00325FA52E
MNGTPPGEQSVTAVFSHDNAPHAQTGPGDILSARYQQHVIRVEVDAYREDDAVSIGKVVAIIDANEQRLKQLGKLTLSDYVRLPDDKRAFEPSPEDNEDGEG